MRCSAGITAVFVLASAFVGGCRGASDRTINLGHATLEMRDPIQVQPPAAVMAFSHDGSLMAVLAPAEDDSSDATGMKLEVREVDSANVVFSRALDEERPFLPVLFDLTGSVLYGTRGREFVVLNLDSGELTTVRRFEPEYEPAIILGLIPGNYDHTLAFIFTEDEDAHVYAVTASGMLMELSIDLSAEEDGIYFDMYGDLWVRHVGAWTKYGRDGEVAPQTHRPLYLVEDQTKVRGSMELVSEETTLVFSGSEAYVSVVWLVHRRAVPNPDEEGEAYCAAVVDVCLDLTDYGFVPGRSMVYLITQYETKLVPFEEVPKETSGSGQ
ncbi:MAG: hypothetical protein IH851_02315 [Armatimonadetes bacterium]|nr:hypothetical protein [Armatimonadota bacterium]